MKRFWMLIALTPACACFAHAAQLGKPMLATPQSGKTTAIRRATFVPPLAGTLANVGWRDATVFAKGYFAIHQGGLPRPSERTAAYVMYDNANLYVGLRMDDKKPELIRAAAKTPLEINEDDWAAFCIKPGPSDQTRYFMVNPAGVKATGSADFAKAGVSAFHMGAGPEWRAVVKRAASGWIAEMAIPLSLLHLSGGKPTQVQLTVVRHIARTGEFDEGPGHSLVGAGIWGAMETARFGDR